VKFDTASSVEMVAWEMRLADYPRSVNRSLINDLFNGFPPYSNQEVRDNNIEVNVNDLSATRLGHEARMQAVQSTLKASKFFSCRTDAKPAHKRQTYQTIVTKEANLPMRKSAPYFEKIRSDAGQTVLHGIAPTHWDDRDKWGGRSMGVEDVLIPSKTLLTMENLQFFAIYQSYTARQIRNMTSGPKVDPGWNMDMVDYMVKWVEDRARTLMGTTWPEVWSPEKMSERIKEDGGLYASDAIPTIDCYDFYFWNDDGKKAGWNRRIIVDTYGGPGAGGTSNKESPRYTVDDSKKGAKGHFLYNPGDRIYGEKLSDIITFQFADLSAVFPARYHSVRSLGTLLFAVCHLQNRMRCKFNEAVLEGLMMYMRVKSGDDVERALKIELISRGIIDESVTFLKPEERWQVNEALAQMGLAENEKIITQNSASYIQNQSFRENQPERKNQLQVMAETNAAISLVSPAMMQAAKYKGFEYEQVFRRLCRKNSRDPDVRTFRNNCLKQGVPEKLLVPEAWEVEPEEIMGAGNKTLEMAIAQQLMQFRNLYDPEPQRKILRDVTLAITDSASRAEELVPDEPVKVTDSVHDAQLVGARLLQGLPVAMKTGVNHIEYVETLLADMALIVKRIEAKGGMATAEEVTGLQNMGQHIAEHIKIVAQDPEEKERVKQEGDNLSNLMNLVRAYAQRLQEQQQKQNGHRGMDPEAQAKLDGKKKLDDAKAANTRESHAARTAQKQVSWEAEEKRKQEQHQLEMRRKIHEVKVDTAATDLQNAAEMRRKRFAGSED